MSDTCGCQFCIDYKRFKTVLPLVPAEHQEWFTTMFDALWNAKEELIDEGYVGTALVETDEEPGNESGC